MPPGKSTGQQKKKALVGVLSIVRIIRNKLLFMASALYFIQDLQGGIWYMESVIKISHKVSLYKCSCTRTGTDMGLSYPRNSPFALFGCVLFCCCGCINMISHIC